MTTEWEDYFASQKYQSKDAAWRNAVLDALAELNMLDEELQTDPHKAVWALVSVGSHRVFRRRSTD